jgi:glucose-1-phosphate adenylyltransferase
VHRHDPDFVVVLSGDHIYRMDYSKMIDYHLRSGADATVAVRRIPIETAHLFGIVQTDPHWRITGFEEKPRQPTSNLISMGIYCFSTRVLVRRLVEMREEQNDDFGRHVFPAMLRQGDRLFAYPDNGYWQDVGTIRAYYDSHMDLLDPEEPLDLGAWKLRANLDENRPGDRPPAYAGPEAQVRQSLLSRGCRIEGTVEGSVLSPGVVVEAGAIVRRSILLHDTRVEAGAVLDTVIVDKACTIGRESQVGGIGDDRVNQRFPQHLDSGITLLGKGSRIPSGSRLGRNVVVVPQENHVLRGPILAASGEAIGDPDG